MGALSFELLTSVSGVGRQLGSRDRVYSDFHTEWEKKANTEKPSSHSDLGFTCNFEDSTPLLFGAICLYFSCLGWLLTVSRLQLPLLCDPHTARWHCLSEASLVISPLLPPLETSEDSGKVPRLSQAKRALHSTALPAFSVSFLVTSPVRSRMQASSPRGLSPAAVACVGSSA